MSNGVAIIGIGMVPFGRHPQTSGHELGAMAVRAALKDASISWRDVGSAYGGSMEAGNADSISAQLGLTGMPFTNVFNGCATGGASISLAVSAIRSGQTDIAVAVGFDKHTRGAFNLQPAQWGLPQWYGDTGLMMTTQQQALMIQRYMYDFGITSDSLTRVAESAYSKGSITPTAWRRTALSYDDISTSEMISDPLRKYMFCSPADGAAAVVICSSKRAKAIGRSPVYVRSVAFRTRLHGAFSGLTPALAPKQPPSPSVLASRAAFEEAGLGPEDIDVIQLQDTESGSLIMNLAENGFCKDGEQERLIKDGALTIGGELPINSDGGCIANGEPVGATGLRQIHEVCVQLRGDAGERQIGGKPRLGYTHVFGAPGVSVVTILEKH